MFQSYDIYSQAYTHSFVHYLGPTILTMLIFYTVGHKISQTILLLSILCLQLDWIAYSIGVAILLSDKKGLYVGEIFISFVGYS